MALPSGSAPDTCLTRQQLFSNAWNGFETQRWAQSVDPSGKCLYHSPYGLRCAIGWSIPNEQYSTKLEYYGIASIGPVLGIAPEDLEFANDLKHVHDNWAVSFVLTPVDERKLSMHRFAHKWSLQVPAPEGASGEASSCET